MMLVRVKPSKCHEPVRLISLRLSTKHSSCVSPIFYFTSANEASDFLVNNAPLTSYEPNFFDDGHFSENTEIFIQESSSDIRSSYLHDSEISDDTMGRGIFSPLFTQERKEPAGRGQAYHSYEESLLPVQSSFARTLMERPVNELSSHQKKCPLHVVHLPDQLGFPLLALVSEACIITLPHFRT